MFSATFSLDSFPAASQLLVPRPTGEFNRQMQSSSQAASQPASQLVRQSVSQLVNLSMCPEGVLLYHISIPLSQPLLLPLYPFEYPYPAPVLPFLAWLKATCVSEIMQNCLSGQQQKRSSSSSMQIYGRCQWMWLPLLGIPRIPWLSLAFIGLSNSFSQQVHSCIANFAAHYHGAQFISKTINNA